MTGGIVGSVVFLLLGALAYSGRWKGWIRVRRGYGSTMGFAWLWLGLAFAVCTVALLTEPYSRPAFFVLCAAAAFLLVVSLVAMFWLPRFLLPAWFRVLRGDRPAVGRSRDAR
ncbi:hypothetical protein QE410_001531 [Microbacterium sp. SORGH_AS 1204]|uniref:hypothetical protein n=1 Tax=Microbacterium sp. SORGH_AS_1204 TaxID=3041785 RepID=UPI00278FCBB8|nr:hypothetical protein [Microbacterium sp. SORGH_AS_1204]MDQ1136732.1 hypothetical protein [Microbacterium sp. SORGH_AS_1204]